MTCDEPHLYSSRPVPPPLSSPENYKATRLARVHPLVIKFKATLFLTFLLFHLIKNTYSTYTHILFFTLFPSFVAPELITAQFLG